MTGFDVDVVVVGQGVVGQFVSLLLADRGHRVLAIEQHGEPYDLPRAVHFDADVNRMLAGLGVDAREQGTFGEPTEHYDWLTADGSLLLTFPTPLEGPQGWPDSTMFSQPGLEAALCRRQATAPALDLRWGTALTGLIQDADGVTVTLSTPDGPQRVRAGYVVGSDGANSTVRHLLGLTVEDRGFDSDWLVMDLKTDRREWHPINGQICDPARPTSSVSGGPGRRRFEFMRMPGEDLATFATEQNAWRLVEPWGLRPSDADLERVAVYSFHARCANRWSEGRVFIAGDAAHLMPPFWGRGMVSGARDAMNLAWKLDLVLRGAAPRELLDTYQTERYTHVQFALQMSIELGRVICETDAEKVAARDAHFLENGPLPWNVLPPMPPEILGPGFFSAGPPGADPVAGLVGEQHPVRGSDGREILLDGVSFGEFLFLVDMRSHSVDDAAKIRGAKPSGIPVKVVEIVPDGSLVANRHSAQDVTGRYAALFDAADRSVIAYRPDFHGFGSAASVSEAVGLIAALDPRRLAFAGHATPTRNEDAHE